MDLQLIWKLTKYITRNGISPKNLSAGSRCTIHHHYAETLLPKFNKKKLSYTPPSSGGDAKLVTDPHPWGGRHPTPYPFFLPSTPLSIPELSLSGVWTFSFLPSLSNPPRSTIGLWQPISCLTLAQRKKFAYKNESLDLFWGSSIGRIVG